MPGQKWKVAITKAIRNSRYFLAILSPNSVNKKGFVNKEILEAFEIVDEYPESEIFIIPVRLNDCNPSHEKLNEYHFVDLFPSWNKGIEKLLKVFKIQIPNNLKKIDIIDKPKIFISYCYEDKEFTDRLIKHLDVLQYEGLIDLWYNKNIKAGKGWSQEIQNAIEETTIAILMVSSNYLTSYFIRNNELPYLIERHKKETLQIFPIITKPCLWNQIKWLTQIEVHPKYGESLSAFDEHKIDSNMISIIEKIIEISTNRKDLYEEDNNHTVDSESLSKPIPIENDKGNNYEDDNFDLPPPPSEIVIVP